MPRFLPAGPSQRAERTDRDPMPSPELWISLLWALAGALLGPALLPVAERLSGTHRQHGTTMPPTVVVPLATAILFGLLAWRVGIRGELLAYSCVAVAGVRLAAIDIAELRLPTRLVWSSCLLTFALFVLAATIDQDGIALLRATTGMVTLPAAYLLLALLSRGGFGMGDVRLAALVGLALGWRSWTAVATGTVLALFYAGTTGLIAITLGRLSKRSPIPYGPAMLAGTFTVILATP